MRSAAGDSPIDKLEASTSLPARRGFLLFLAFCAPVLICIWAVPWFVTQDGPLHLYNAHILSSLSHENSAFANYYSARSGALPYLAVYKLLSGLMSAVSARAADRLMMTLTSIGFGCSVLWLRWRVRGSQAMNVVVPLIALAAVSKLWVLGLYSFLLGACVFPIVLGLWWKWRNDLKPVRASIIAIILAGAYFFHIISTGLTAFALVVLALLTPGVNVRRRIVWTLASVVPASILIVGFGAVVKSTSNAPPEWVGLTSPFSIASWIDYLQTADFISFSFKENLGLLYAATDCPFVEKSTPAFFVFGPTLWAGVGIVALLASMASSSGSSSFGGLTKARLFAGEKRGWLALAACLVVAGLFGPNAVGQGTILRERLLLMATVTIVVLINPPVKSAATRIGAICLTVAAALQIAFVVDYARISNHRAGAVMAASNSIGPTDRVVLLMADARTPYAISALPWAANQLGVSGEAIIWNNWSPQYYYYPLAFRNDHVTARWQAINDLSQALFSGEAEAIAAKSPRAWADSLTNALDETDVLIVWGSVSWFDIQQARWFEPKPIFEQGEVRVFRRRLPREG